MDTPEESKTPRIQGKSGRKSFPLLTNKSANSSSSSSLLTPCRRVGLKRKSTPGNLMHTPSKDTDLIAKTILNRDSSKLEDLHGTNGSSENYQENETSCITPLKVVPSTTTVSVKLVDSSQKNEESNEVIPDKTQSASRKPCKKLMSSTRRFSTPLSSKCASLTQHSLNKKLKVPDNTLNCSKADSSKIEDKFDSAELRGVLSKDYSSFLKLHNDICVHNEEADSEENLKKREVLTRMKKMYDKLEESKQFLVNAKQHDINNLKELIEKWKGGCQKALMMLLKKLQEEGHSCDMKQLLLKFRIPNELINYDEDNEEFLP